MFGEFQIAEAKQYDPIFDHCIANEPPEPFGIRTWDSSMANNLVVEKIYSEGLFQDKKIVCDLGSGTGLSSLLLKLLSNKSLPCIMTLLILSNYYNCPLNDIACFQWQPL